MSAHKDFIDLESCALEDRHEPTATRFRVRIDDDRYNIEDPKPTGRQLLRLADKRPTDQYLVFLILRGGGFEEIQLDETIDLTRRGTERFLTFESSASYRLEIDGQRIGWGTKLVTGRKLKELAGVDPATYVLWQEVRGGEESRTARLTSAASRSITARVATHSDDQPDPRLSDRTRDHGAKRSTRAEELFRDGSGREKRRDITAHADDPDRALR